MGMQGASPCAPTAPLLLRHRLVLPLGCTKGSTKRWRCAVLAVQLFLAAVTVVTCYSKGAHHYGDAAAAPQFEFANATSL